jgi:hypothetical protein
LWENCDVSCCQLAFHGFFVFAQSGRANALRSTRKRRLGRLLLLMFPKPGFERLILQRASVRETELPRFRPFKLIDRFKCRVAVK